VITVGTHRVVVVAFEGVRLLDVTAPLEVFTTADRLSPRAYEVIVCSPDGHGVRSAAGLRVGVDMSAAAVDRVDTLVVPGVADPADFFRNFLWTRTVAELAARASRVAAVCTGAFALAEAGLLHGRRATTHWEHADLLGRRYPHTTVTADAIYVRDGSVMTSAGVSAGIDVCLAMVEEDLGPSAAREVARDLVVFLQRPGGQSQFSVASRVPPTGHPVLRPLLDRIAADPAGDWSVQALAALAGVSVRHVTRLFNEQVGTTPAAHVEAVRLEAARILLEQGEGVTSAARRSGMGSDETLRRAFARHLRTTPSAYAARFRTARTVA
jgi:transcriptional regulator GlxA family with amidase domain